MGMLKGAKFQEAYSKLDLGVPKQTVINMLGEPDSKRLVDGIEKYTWVSREFKGLLRGGSVERKIIVEFKDGVICGYDGENIKASIW